MMKHAFARSISGIGRSLSSILRMERPSCLGSRVLNPRSVRSFRPGARAHSRAHFAAQHSRTRSEEPSRDRFVYKALATVAIRAELPSQRVRLPNGHRREFWWASGAGHLRLGKRRPKRRPTALRSQLAAFLVALSLVVQLFAAATPPAMAAPAFAGADDAAIAAELKALFGDTAQLCVQVNDDKASGQAHPSGHCCDQCPLCRFAAQAVAFVSPDLPALPGRSIATRMRSARRLATTFFPPIPPSQIRPGPLPSQSDGHSPARLRRALAFLQTRGLPSMSLLRIRLAAGALAGAFVGWEPSLPTPTPSAATASSPPRWRSTIPASPMNSPFRSFTWLPKNSDGVAGTRHRREWAKTIFPNFAISAGIGATWLHAGRLRLGRRRHRGEISVHVHPSARVHGLGRLRRRVGRERDRLADRSNRTCIRRCSMSAWASALCRKA